MRIRAVKIGFMAAVASTALWGGSGVAAAGGGCHSTPTASEGTSVEISDMCFDATVLYVDPGTEVTWTNLDSMTHDVIGVGDTWGDPGLSLLKGDDVSYRFDSDGVYPYACWIHPGMVGAVVVGDGVGTDLTSVVPGSSGGDPGATEVASAPLAQSGSDDTTAIWVVVGTALVLGAFGGAFAVAMRNRRKEPVAG